MSPERRRQDSNRGNRRTCAGGARNRHRARLVLALLFRPPNETGNAGHNNGAIPAGLLAGERRVARTDAANHGRLPPYPKRSDDPSFRAKRNRTEEAMPLAFGCFFMVDAHNSFEASRQIIAASLSNTEVC
jgi:hypothetical protein